MKSIYLRNYAATALLVLLAFFVVIVSVAFLGRAVYIRNTGIALNKSAEEVSRIVSAVGDSENLAGNWRLNITISSLSEVTEKHILLTDNEGTVVACSDAHPTCSHVGIRLGDDILSRVSSDSDSYFMANPGNIFPNDYMCTFKPVQSAEGVQYSYVLVSSEETDALGEWKSLSKEIMVICLFVCIISLLLSFFFAKRMGRPLDDMAAASRKFAKGDFSVRVDETRTMDSEIFTLVRSFNQMADSLEKSEQRRREFIANISHELRTPMTTISGFADGILDGTIPEENRDKYLRSISDETKRLARLAREMLDVSQMDDKSKTDTSRQIFDVTELLLQVLLSFESRAMAKNLDVDPQLPEKSIFVSADKDSITRVIYNLLDNAVKFADRDTCITIKIYKNEEKAFISVADEGQDIPEDDLPYIFDRFHKSDKSRSIDKDGVGLGLYLVKTIINNHDEDIAVTSRDGITEFVFTLSLAKT